MNSIQEIIVYTDGACSGNPGPGGYAWILQSDGKEYECVDIANDTTNNRMELSAVASALNFILEKFKKSNSKDKIKVKIYCDSKYICDAINQGWLKYWANNDWKKKDKTPVKNTDLWMDIYSSLQAIDTEFLWVEGHNGNELNEYCDKLAHNAALRTIEPHLIDNVQEEKSENKKPRANDKFTTIKIEYKKDNSVKIIQNDNTIIINKDNLNDFIKIFAEVIIKLNS